MARRNSLAKHCGFQRGKVPDAWLELGPGAQYRGESCTPLGGKVVRLKGSDWRVRGCGTPVKPPSGALHKRSRRYVCQGSIILAPPGSHGPTRAVPKSIVLAAARRQEQRPRKLCDHQARTFLTASSADLRAIEREAEALGIHPWELVGDYEFPHAEGAGPCCPYADTGVRESFDPDAAWQQLRQRVAGLGLKATLGTAREVARKRQRLLRAGGDANDANYTETLRGRGAGRVRDNPKKDRVRAQPGEALGMGVWRQLQFPLGYGPAKQALVAGALSCLKVAREAMERRDWIENGDYDVAIDAIEGALADGSVRNFVLRMRDEIPVVTDETRKYGGDVAMEAEGAFNREIYQRTQGDELTTMKALAGRNSDMVIASALGTTARWLDRVSRFGSDGGVPYNAGETARNCYLVLLRTGEREDAAMARARRAFVTGIERYLATDASEVPIIPVGRDNPSRLSRARRRPAARPRRR